MIVKLSFKLFVANKETKDLIAEIKSEAGIPASGNSSVIKTIRGGNTKRQGTYVCKELVYRYAMWISPKFALLVIRTFDKLVTGELQVKPTGLSNTTDRKPLIEAVNMYCAKTGAIYSDVWKLVHQRFGLEGVHELTVDQVPQVVEYIHSLLIQAQQATASQNADYINAMHLLGEKKAEEIRHTISVAQKTLTSLEYDVKSALKALDCSVAMIETHNATQASVFKSLKSQNNKALI